MHGRILVLDDEENYAEMLQKLLQQHHFLVDSSTRPQAALEALEENEYRLVIADYKMPVMDGADFLERARQIRPNLPVIIVSGLMNTPELVKVANMSVTLALEKPLDIKSFITHVSRFVDPLQPEDWAQQERERLEKAGGKSKKLVASYPRPLLHLADVCESSQFFVQGLKERTVASRQVFIQAAKGCEYELIAREASVWQNAPERRIYFFSASELFTADTRELLAHLDGRDPFSPIVVVGHLEQLDGEQAAAFLQFLDEGQHQLPAADALTFLYFSSGVFDRDSSEAQAALADRFLGNPLRLPPLNQRLCDLATYARRFADLFADRERKTAAREIEPESLAMLLQHDWPGDFLELLDVLQRAVTLNGNEALKSASVAGVLQRRYPNGAIAQTPGLSDAVLHCQNTLLHKEMEQEQSDPQSTYSRLGINSPHLKREAPPSKQPLLYPELVQ